MHKFFIPLLSLIILSAGCKQKKVEIRLTDIKQEEEIQPPPPPPPPKQDFDLSSFNVFIRNEGTLYYYHEPGFTSTDGRSDDIRRINKKFLHRSTAAEINKVLRKLEQQGLLKGKKIWFVSEHTEQEEIQKVISAVLADSGMSEIWIGTLHEDLLTLLKSEQ